MTKKSEVDLRILKQAVNRILDHMIVDMGMSAVTLEHDLYWTIGGRRTYDLSGRPSEREVGNLWDDWEFVSDIPEGEGLPAVYQLTEIAPLLAYIGETFELFGDGGGSGTEHKE